MKNKLLFQNLVLLLIYVFVFTACGQPQQTTPFLVPTITPIAGWHKIANEGFEIWLPENFVGGTKISLEAMAQQLAELGPDFEQQANALKAAKISFTIIAFDKNRGDSSRITNLTVSKETVPSNISVENYMETLGNNVKEPLKVSETKTLTSDRYLIGVLIIDADIPQVGEISQAMYVIKNGGAVWQILFTTPTSEFQERLPIFEEIVESVTVPFTPEDRSRQGNPIIFGIGVGLFIISMILSYWQRRKKKKKEEIVA